MYHSKHSLPLAACTLALLSACNTSAAPAPDARVEPDASAESPDATAPETVEARLARHLTGSFSSARQAADDARYFDIHLEVCPVLAPALAERVLYVEQAVATSLDRPYRQRLYVVERGGAEDEGVSRVFELAAPATWVGACAEAAPRVAVASDAIERVGCAVRVRWTDERFEGGTVGMGCQSTLMGASYATSEVTISDALLESWDRGFDDEGMQVWGATAGAYRFDRL